MNFADKMRKVVKIPQNRSSLNMQNNDDMAFEAEFADNQVNQGSEEAGAQEYAREHRRGHIDSMGHIESNRLHQNLQIRETNSQNAQMKPFDGNMHEL